MSSHQIRLGDLTIDERTAELEAISIELAVGIAGFAGGGLVL